MTPATPILLSRVHHPVRNLGFGVRAGIWFQGCTIGCRGCLARDTWSFDPATRCDVDTVLGWLRRLPGQLDGITISGGEPTDQPEALRALLDGMARWRSENATPADILLYSGRPLKWLRTRYDWLLDGVDALVTEPFVAARAGTDALRGSSNQRVHALTDLGRTRYGEEIVETAYAAQRRHIGLHVDGGSIRLIGIPLPGQLDELAAALATRGIELDETTWPI